MSYEQIAKRAENYYDKGFTPDVLPGCANFVSHCVLPVMEEDKILAPQLIRENKNWVPNWYNAFTHSTVPLRGRPVIFDYTYDADGSGVIDSKDDLTHIGIMIDSQEFLHYSGGKVKLGNITDSYWKSKTRCFLTILPKDVPVVTDKEHNFKLFIKPNKWVLIVDGKEIPKDNVSSIELQGFWNE